MSVCFASIRTMNAYCGWTGVLKGRIDSFCGNLSIFSVLTASNGDTFSPPFDCYCLYIGPKAKLLSIKSKHFVSGGSRDMRYGQLGNYHVGFCLF